MVEMRAAALALIRSVYIDKDPLSALDSEVRWRSILEVRRSVIRQLGAIPGGNAGIYRTEAEQQRHVQLRDLVISLQDGDLAYTTHRVYTGHGGERRYILGDTDFANWLVDLRFSPEQQLIIANGDEWSHIAFDLAMHPHLTDECQLAIRRRQGTTTRMRLIRNTQATSIEFMKEVLLHESEQERMLLVFCRDDFPEEIVEIIGQDLKLNLIYRAKTDPEAELEMLRNATGSRDIYLIFQASTYAKLLSEEAVRILVSKHGERIRQNDNIQNHNDLVDRLTR